MQKLVSKKDAAKMLGISEQMIMRHAKLLEIQSGRMPVKTKKRGVQYMACFTMPEFQRILNRQHETGIKKQ